MSVIVEVPGHGEVEFPDGMSDEEMSDAIRKNFMLTTPKKASPSMVGKLAKGLVMGGPVGLAAQRSSSSGSAAAPAEGPCEGSPRSGLFPMKQRSIAASPIPE